MSYTTTQLAVAVLRKLREPERHARHARQLLRFSSIQLHNKSGTATERPVFNFAVIKAVAA